MARQGMAGIEIFTLQGKKILRYMFNNAEDGDIITNLRRHAVPQMYYAKFLPDVFNKRQ
jgi:hypothetical protein